MEPKGHEELRHDDANDEDEGDVEDDGGGDAADAICVDGADFDDFDKTLTELAVAETRHEIGNVGSANFLIQCSIAEVVEDGGIADLCWIQPG